MAKPAIKVQGLYKEYAVGHALDQHDTFYELLTSTLKAPLKRLRKLGGQAEETDKFWALQDVNFDILPGEVVGIIGRNGAGKSTLLKVLSRITAPTKGKIEVRGRLASLLEVGTGFHPELSGRENIYLNGAILGMSRREVARKFDEIVAFAEIDKFIDTPVKRYSSGMYVRLAFAVAAHLESDILVVDEVLAVGDAEFQKRCLGKMKEVSSGGRTIFFVSHNMAAIGQLCQKTIHLERGNVLSFEATQTCIERYLQSGVLTNEVQFTPDKAKPSITFIRIAKTGLDRGDLEIDIGFSSPMSLTPPIVGLVIKSPLGVPVFGSNPRFHGFTGQAKSVDHGVVKFVAEKLPLTSGTYSLSVWLGDSYTDYDQKQDVITFNFRQEKAHINRPSSEAIGYLDWPGSWTIT